MMFAPLHALLIVLDGVPQWEQAVDVQRTDPELQPMVQLACHPAQRKTPLWNVPGAR